jgi:hypothetical protein
MTYRHLLNSPFTKIIPSVIFSKQQISSLQNLTFREILPELLPIGNCTSITKLLRTGFNTNNGSDFLIH